MLFLIWLILVPSGHWTLVAFFWWWINVGWVLNHLLQGVSIKTFVNLHRVFVKMLMATFLWSFCRLSHNCNAIAFGSKGRHLLLHLLEFRLKLWIELWLDLQNTFLELILDLLHFLILWICYYVQNLCKFALKMVVDHGFEVFGPSVECIFRNENLLL